jgi:hypothetical protein
VKGKIPLQMYNNRWEDNIEMERKEKNGFEVMHWTRLVQSRAKWWAFLKAIMDVRVPKMALNLLGS